MNNNQGSLYFSAGIDMKEWRKGVEDMRRDVLGLSKQTQTETSKMDASFRNLGIGLGAYFSTAALGGFVKEVINIRGEFQKTEIAFETMLGSSAKAKVLLEQMVDLAAKTPFSLQDVSSGAKQLLAFQVPANEIVDTLTRMGNIASGLGVPLSRLNLVYGQVKAKGRLMGDDLRQFTEAGIPMIAELAKKFDTSTTSISKMVTEGKIGFNDVKDVLFDLTNEGGMFFNLMEKQAASLSGKVSNLGDAFDQMLNKIGQSNQGLLGGGIDAAGYLVENYEEVIEVIGVAVASYGVYKTALIFNTVLQSNANRTIASEIGLLGISNKMKLGRLAVTARQAAATNIEAVSELNAAQAKYVSLQAEVSSLAIKKQKLAALALEKTQLAQAAAVQLQLARQELASLGASATARQITIATKKVESQQNKVLLLQDSASIARKNALTASSTFYTTQKQLETTATVVGAAAKGVETTQEVLVTASKNLNTLATTRLTLAQRVSIFTTNAFSKAMAFLNSTLLANPIALVVGALAGLSYVIYKNVTATSAYVDLQAKLTEENKRNSETTATQKDKIEGLIATIKRKETTDAVAKSALKQINKLTNNRISGLSVEAIRLGKSTEAVKDYVAMLQLESNLKGLMATKEAAQAKKRELSSADNFDVDFSDYFLNIKEVKDIGLSPQQRKLKAIAEDLKGAQKIIDETDIAIIELQKKGVNIVDEIGGAVEADNIKGGEEAARKLAEIFSKGSIADLEKRISLWNEALQKASGDNVDVLNENKFGDTIKTGKKVSVNEANAQLKALTDAKTKREKEISIKSFDEQMSETKRQIEVRDKLLKEGYSKETVDAMFPEVKDQSFIQYLQKTSSSLDKLILSGDKSEQTATNLVNIQEAIKTFKGYETFADGVSQSIDELKSKFTGTDLISELEKFGSLTIGNPTEEESNFKEQTKNKAIEEEKKRVNELYTTLLKEQQTYEEQSIALQKEYEDVKKTQSYQDSSPKDKAKIDNSFKTQQGDLDVAMIMKSEEWKVAFGELEGMSNTSLQAILAKLLEFKEKTKGTLSLQDSAELEKAIQRVQDAAVKNPFKNISQSIDGYFKSLKAAKEAQKEYNQAVKDFGLGSKEANDAQQKMISTDKESVDAKQKLFDKLDKGQEIFNAVGEGVMALGDAFGGMDDATKDAIEDVMAIGNAALDLGKSIASGDVAGMIKAGIALITSLAKALSGDKKKERAVKKQAEALKVLENAYNDLAFAAERAFGSMKYKGQTDLIKNLEQQKIAIQGMIASESSKKKKDNGKIEGYNEQVKQINQSITSLKEGIIKDVLQTEIPDMASKMGDALLDAFSKGEDGIKALNATFDDMVKNILKNQLNKVLEGQMTNLQQNLLKAAGFNADGTGSFDGFTEAELVDLRAQYQTVAQNGKALAEAIAEMSGGAEVLAEGMQGDIKGVTEKTAGALEAQINAIRIYQVEAVTIHKANQAVFINSLQNLVQIESNTRNLLQIRQDISEMNGKMSKDLAGIG